MKNTGKSKPPLSWADGTKLAKVLKSHVFLGSEAGKHYSYCLRSGPIDVFPEIMSDDPRYLAFCSRLATRLDEELPKKRVLESGFYDEFAISTNFQELNTVAGYNMKPATYAVIDNTALRDEMFLCRDFQNDRDRQIFAELMACRYKEHDGTRGKISRISSSTFPFFSKSMELKSQHLSLLLSKGEKFKKLVMEDNLEDLFEEFKVLFAMVDVYRSQADVFKLDGSTYKPKERFVNDIEYANSGGRLGKRFIADKSVVIHGRLLDGKAAARARTAFGYSNVLNLIMTAAFEGFRHAGDLKFGKTFKHRSRAEILEKIEQYENVVPVDVTQFDQSVPKFLMDEWIKLSPFNEFGKKILSLMVTSPMFYRGVSEDTEPYWSGDPFDIDYYNQYRGLISGLFSTSAMGKDFFTFCTLTMLDKVYGDVLGNVEKILKWEHPAYAITNMGDDTNIHFNGKSFRSFVTSQMETQQYGMSQYFKVDLEDGFKFLGNIGYINKDGKKRLCGDIGTYLKNMLVPERGVSSKHRKYAVYGLLERRHVYADHPLFQIVDQIFMEEFARAFSISWIDLMEKHLELPVSEDVYVRTQAELEVLLDPSKLHYKYSEEDINPTVLEIIEQRISEDDTDLAISLLIEEEKQWKRK